jgi:polyphosphate glucokinase
MLFDSSGRPISEKIRVPTPHPATPKAIFQVLKQISAEVNGKFQQISAGFPGVVKDGVTINAPNLSPAWKEFRLQQALEHDFSVEARVANDADLQGMGAGRGKGVELTITLGTGLGSSLIYNGNLLPNLELGHHPFRHSQSYEEQLGKEALEAVGKERWNQRVRKMIRNLETAFNHDALYLGGGNAKYVSGKLPPNVRLISNEYGMLGGVRLWVPNVRLKPRYLTAA